VRLLLGCLAVVAVLNRPVYPGPVLKAVGTRRRVDPVVAARVDRVRTDLVLNGGFR
jgi:hypothetical protein